jgi:hypothetical protein
VLDEAEATPPHAQMAEDTPEDAEGDRTLDDV